MTPHEHEHDFWVTPAGTLECACGKSRIPQPEKEEENDEH